MVKTAEQKREANRRYKLKYPERVKEDKRKYLDRKILRENGLGKVEKRLLHEFTNLTRLQFNNSLPMVCAVCGTIENLQIHHIRYVYPVVESDLVRLCCKHHIEEHQKITPSLVKGESPSFPMELEK